MDNNNTGRMLKTDRSWWKFLIFTLLTCGIYSIVFFSSISDDINLIATRRDGKKTMHYCMVFFLLGPITCGIFTIVWMHMLSNRIGEEARARGIDTNFSASTFWLWNVLGSLIIVGPFIYLHKMCEALNGACASYNQHGM